MVIGEDKEKLNVTWLNINYYIENNVQYKEE